MFHRFIELHKPLYNDKAVICEGETATIRSLFIYYNYKKEILQEGLKSNCFTNPDGTKIWMLKELTEKIILNYIILNKLIIY